MGELVVGVYWVGDGVDSILVLLFWSEAEGEDGEEVDYGCLAVERERGRRTLCDGSTRNEL